MKVRKFKIRIQAAEEKLADSLVRTLELAEKGIIEDPDYDLVITFPDLSWLPKVISPEKIRLIQTVRNQHPDSVYRLAKLLGRHLSNVQRDVSELAHFGILELKKISKKGSKRQSLQPIYDWSGFDIAV